MMEPSAPPPAIDDVGRAMRAFQGAVDDFDREVARLLGVNETDLRCLEILLQDVAEAAPSQLARSLGLSSGAVTPMLDRLERAGYVVRSPHPTDRRKTIVQASPLAAELAYSLIGPLVAEGGEQLMSRYTASELRLVVDFLRSSTEIQERHVARLRLLDEPPAPAHARH